MRKRHISKQIERRQSQRFQIPNSDFRIQIEYTHFLCVLRSRNSMSRGGSRGGCQGGSSPPLAPQNTLKPPLAHQKLQNAWNKISIYFLDLQISLMIWYIKISIIIDNCMFYYCFFFKDDITLYKTILRSPVMLLVGENPIHVHNLFIFVT